MRIVYLLASIVLVCSCVMAFQPFSLEHAAPSDDLPMLRDKFNRNMDKIDRYIAQVQARTDSAYVQRGYISSAQFGWNALGGWWDVIVYLDHKYKDANSYQIFFSRTAPVVATTANQLVSVFTDSSFTVQSDTTGNGVYWMTIGVKEPD